MDKIYIQAKKNAEVSKRNIRISDVCDVHCIDLTVENRVKSMHLLTIKEVKRKRVCMSVLAVIRAIGREYPEADVINIGVEDFIVDYIYEKRHNVWLQRAAILGTSIFTFVGSSYAIIAYNNDVGTIEIFNRVYEFFGAGNLSESNIIEAAYAVGLALGIIVFYNHFAGKKITTDPAPVEVEMQKYEKDVDDTLINRSEAVNEKVTKI